MAPRDIPKNSWQIIKPIQTSNFVLNPSAENTGSYSAVGSATITRSTTYAKYGLYSYRIQTVATNTGLTLTLGTLTNSEHWVTFRARGILPKELRLSIGPDSKKAIFIEQIDDYWALYGAMFGASESNGRTAASITQFGTGSGDFYVDGIQVEPLADWTTYCDGTQEGCEWNGAEHGSTSSRSGEYIGGGTPQDLYQEYKFFVTKIIGAGASTPTLSVDSYAILPGGELNSIKTESRQFSLIGKFITDTEQELHDSRQDLIKTLKLATPGQPLKLRFSGGRVQKEIGVFYQGGLEGDLAEFYDNFEPIEDDGWAEVRSYVEKASIQFSAPDPYWYEIGESAASLENASDTGLYQEQDANDSATFRTIAGRLRSTGQWSPLGPPGAGGTYSSVLAIAEDDIYIYIGGSFANWDGIAAADNIVRYNKQTGVYSAMGTGGNSFVSALAIMPNGDVIAGGAFTLMGGVANTVHIARWNGTAWLPLGTGMNSSVSALTVGLDGNLYAGGAFTTAGGVSTPRVAYWTGTIWVPLGLGVDDGQVLALATGLDGKIYVGGSFTSVALGSVPDTVSIASWDGQNWAALDTGLDNTVFSLAVSSPSGLLYAGGVFTVGSTQFVGAWNGASWQALGDGTNSNVFSLDVGPDGEVYAGGTFTEPSERIARWNGYSWAHVDISLPGLPTVFSILASRYTDPVIKQKYNVYLGFNTSGTGTFSGKTTVVNDGNVPVSPQVFYSRLGGTLVNIAILSNERTAKELILDYRLLSGESLTIDLSSSKKSVVSSFFGSRLDAILPNSDFGTWALLPGSNDITTFVIVSGGPALVAYLLWRDTFDSWD